MPSATSGSGLRVAMVIQRFRPEFSGQGIQVEHLCRALARRGAEPMVLASIRGGPSEWEACEGFRVRRVRCDLLPGSTSLGSVWMPTFGLRVLMALLLEPKVDVVHVHGLNDGIYGAYAFCRLRGVPLVFEMTLMGVDDPSSALATRQMFAGARRRVFRGCDAYVAMSRAFLPSYARAGMPPDRLHVIPQGVDTGRFRPFDEDARAAVRAELGISVSAPVIVFVGSLIERKGIDVLLDAWARVHAQRPDARLLLVGPDTFEPGSHDRRFLDGRFAALPSAARAAVQRTGVRDDPERLLASADIFVFPSRREGFGSVIIEAMACGVPSVVARLDGITDFLFAAPIQAGATASGQAGDGIVVPQQDASCLADIVLRLLAEPRWARAIGLAGLDTVRERFDFDTAIAPAYGDLYARLTTRGPGRG
jgi:glycosyltransferase involved in cell wall biosynthesis